MGRTFDRFLQIRSGLSVWCEYNKVKRSFTFRIEVVFKDTKQSRDYIGRNEYFVINWLRYLGNETKQRIRSGKYGSHVGKVDVRRESWADTSASCRGQWPSYAHTHDTHLRARSCATTGLLRPTYHIRFTTSLISISFHSFHRLYFTMHCPINLFLNHSLHLSMENLLFLDSLSS